MTQKFDADIAYRATLPSTRPAVNVVTPVDVHEATAPPAITMLTPPKSAPNVLIILLDDPTPEPTETPEPTPNSGPTQSGPEPTDTQGPPTSTQTINPTPTITPTPTRTPTPTKTPAPPNKTPSPLPRQHKSVWRRA